MKKKVLAVMLCAVMALSMAACGGSEKTESGDVAVNSAETQAPDSSEVEKETSTEASSEVPEEMELPNWKGLPTYVRGSCADGDYGVYVSFPNMVPKDSYEFAYQWDPSLVLVTNTGKDENYYTLKVENIEDTFSISKDIIIKRMDDYRKSEYTDFDFLINAQETMTINDLPCCYYEGVHTYKKSGEDFEIPFVAYSFYTGQIENYSYFTIVVLDDSINHATSMEPLAEGTIEAYARKMVESVDLREYDILYGY